jgi:metalloendopeptidase OMA1, mitochondrial
MSVCASLFGTKMLSTSADPLQQLQLRAASGGSKKSMAEHISASDQEASNFPPPHHPTIATTNSRSTAYYYPNDPPESVRLDYQSCVLDYALDGKLHMAPLTSPLSILDVGAGTGAWAIQMASQYPSAKIEGTDLSPIQPADVPENVTFIIDDAEEDDWTLHENYYDYIHTRVLLGCFEDFGSIVRKGFRYTKPGGWMESLEIMHPPFCDDGTMAADWPFKEWSETMEDAAKTANRPLGTANRLKKWYAEAGFVDVHEKIIKIPINSWPRDPKLKMLGKYWAENFLAGLQGFSLVLFSRVFGWTKSEIEVRCIL